MFNDLSFDQAFEHYQMILNIIPDMLHTLSEAGMECIVDALHTYAKSGSALECSEFDLDFCRLFTLAYRKETGYDVLPEYSCLTDWSGAKCP